MFQDGLCIGHVIRIIDKYTVIIDVGKDSLSLGKKVQIYALGDPLYNLSGEEISRFVHVKDTLKVTDVQSGYSVCKKLKTMTRKTGFSLALSPLLEADEEYETPEVLNVIETEIEALSPVDPMIHVGDAVKFA